MIAIIDVIKHKNKYSTQTFVVVDGMPDFKYERVGNHLIAEDSGFFYFYGYQGSTEAFAGAKFDIPLKNGGFEKAAGQWWHCIPHDYIGLVHELGIGAPENLGKCNVFSSAYVDIDIFNNFMASNEPSNNYHKYDKRDKNYGVHLIESKF